MKFVYVNRFLMRKLQDHFAVAPSNLQYKNIRTLQRFVTKEALVQGCRPASAFPWIYHGLLSSSLWAITEFLQKGGSTSYGTIFIDIGKALGTRFF
jgi:hypothetical protein